MNRKQELIPTLVSGEVDNLMQEILQRELKGWKKDGLLIRCIGSLMNLNARRDAMNGRGDKLFGVTLNADGSLQINAKKRLLEDFEDGDYVEVVGYPIINIFQGKVSIQLEVIGARLAESVDDQAKRRDNHSNFARLISLKPTRNPFPVRSSVTLDMIYSKASVAQVDTDFRNGLGDQSWRCSINAIPVRITSAEEIAQAIQESNADILVVIRGGGPEADFQVFNHDLVLRSLSAKASYRVMGVGHSANTNMVDLIADYSAAVPAEAGAHIRDQFRHLAAVTDQLEVELEESQETIENLQDKYESLQRESKAEIERLHSSFQTQRYVPVKKGNTLHWVLIAVLATTTLVLALSSLVPIQDLQEWLSRAIY